MSLLKGTPFAFLVPVSDSIVVIGLSVAIIFKPVRTVFAAAGEVVGNSAHTDIVERLRGLSELVLDEKPYSLLDVAAVKTGRSLFAAAYIRPDAEFAVADLDALRETLQARCASIFPAIKTEIIFTANKPFAR